MILFYSIKHIKATSVLTKLHFPRKNSCQLQLKHQKLFQQLSHVYQQYTLNHKTKDAKKHTPRPLKTLQEANIATNRPKTTYKKHVAKKQQEITGSFLKKAQSNGKGNRDRKKQDSL